MKASQLLGGLLLILVAVSTVGAQNEVHRGLGYLGPPELLPASAVAGSVPPLVFVTARWEDDGWDEARRRLTTASDRGLETVLVLDGDPDISAEGAIESWRRFVRAAHRELGTWVDHYQIHGSTGESDATNAEDYAFLLKDSAVALRAAAAGDDRAPSIVQATLTGRRLDWQERLWNLDVAAYVDVLPISIAGDARADDRRAWLGRARQAQLQHPPASRLWAIVSPGSDPWDAPAAAVEALALGADRGVARMGAGDTEQLRWLLGVHRRVSEGYAPAPLGQLSVSDGDGQPLPGGLALARFFNDADFSTLVVFRAPGDTAEFPTDRLVIDTKRLRNPKLLDLHADADRSLRSVSVGGSRAIVVPRGPAPLLVRYVKGAGGLEAPSQEIQRTGSRDLTAEEIIARYQQVQREQDDRLDRWTGKARTDFHFKLGTGGSFDLSIESVYYWERGSQVEWEQTEYFVNGTKVRWKNIPEIPFFQPEKVLTLPLDLTLDRTYAYRRAGLDRVDGRKAYVLAFEPIPELADQSLYRGKLWIDTETFERVKANAIQTNLTSPVLSNEEVDLFDISTDREGRPYRMLSRIEGQQIWSATGRNFVVLRDVEFLEYDLNPTVEEFEARRAASYASDNQMLRDTDDGFRYLQREEDGTRTVKTEVNRSAIFAAAGAFKDGSSDGFTPLAGVSYFNYDLFHKDIQFNVLFAGVLAFANGSKPNVWGSKFDITVDATLSALKGSDERFAGDDELVFETIERRSQSLAVRVSRPFGSFFKANLIGSARAWSYFDDKDTERLFDDLRMDPMNPVDLEYRLPQDHTLIATALDAEYNRRGWSLTANVTRASRSEWEEFGLFDIGNDTYLVYDPMTEAYIPGAPEEVFDSFMRWRVSAFKEWYLAKFQKLRVAASFLEGEDLDRFSKFQFSLLGADRLAGFAGSGVRFDRGVIVRTGYAFNLFDVVQLDALVENASVEEKALDLGSQSFTGVRLQANTVGPWKTVINLNYGYALKSDIPELEGESELFLLILKLF